MSKDYISKHFLICNECEREVMTQYFGVCAVSKMIYFEGMCGHCKKLVIAHLPYQKLLLKSEQARKRMIDKPLLRDMQSITEVVQ